MLKRLGFRRFEWNTTNAIGSQQQKLQKISRVLRGINLQATAVMQIAAGHSEKETSGNHMIDHLNHPILVKGLLRILQLLETVAPWKVQEREDLQRDQGSQMMVPFFQIVIDKMQPLLLLEM
jgi:hypothetical protein